MNGIAILFLSYLALLNRSLNPNLLLSSLKHKKTALISQHCIMLSGRDDRI